MKFKAEATNTIANPRSAFTLAEVLAAMVFMAILIPEALEGLSIASRAGEVAARKNEGAQDAEKIQNEKMATRNLSTIVQTRTGGQRYRYFWREWNKHCS